MKKIILSVLVLGLIVFSGCTGTQTQRGNDTSTTAPGDYMIKTYMHPEVGEMLTDKNGMALYVFTRDEAYKSNCYDVCEQNWPPLYIEGEVTMSPDLEGKIETIVRDTGKKQLAYRGMPLYRYVNDQSPGDILGQGVNGLWVVASTAPLGPRPEPSEETTTTQPEATTTTEAAATTTLATTPALSGVIEVEIKGGAFSPAEVRIKKGSTVDWTNAESMPHTVTSDSGDELASDTLMKGQSYSHTFTKAGTYAYHCGFHTGMKGKVIVEA